MMASLGRKLTSNFQQFQHPFKHKQPTKKTSVVAVHSTISIDPAATPAMIGAWNR